MVDERRIRLRGWRMRGVWCDHMEDIFYVTTSYFTSLFWSSGATTNEEILQAIDRCVTPMDNEMLCRNFTPEEVTQAFSQVNPSKAPAIVNQLKPLMSVCIAENQCAFVPGRRISDNFLVTHELILYLKGSKNGPNKWAAIKLDMEKAYDRVEWDFVLNVMLRMGFNVLFVCIIRKCISTVSFQGLSALLLVAQRRNELKGIRASLRGPRISYLLYADDSIIPNTPVADLLIFLNLLGVVESLDPGNYLGLPLTVGKDKRAAFNFIEDKTVKRIQGVIEDIKFQSRSYWWSWKHDTRGNQVWRLIHDEESLAFKVLKAKYFPCTNFLDAKLGDMHSYAWASIMKANDALKDGFFWRVGIDSKARLFSDNWGDSGLIRWKERYLDSADQPVRVADFLLPGCPRWDELKVRRVLSSEDASQVLNTLIAPVRSAGTKLKQANLREGLCQLCNIELESALHAIKDFPKSKMILLMSGFSQELVVWEGNSCLQWITRVQSKLNREGFDLFLTLLWNIWNHKNKWIHGAKLQSDRDIISKAWNLIGEFKQVSKPLDCTTGENPPRIPRK
ncbi:uncharacterized protein LOC120151856 [Hibiscus syriacus]|uniref:uncharacterized protein LOC120151856 n=1 Tax=Hibiscus syriacus TaxID=106335 RepID=UPI001920A297|nr:uncharacterized protein LOC120151856 [Hibiscus syriacus]